MIKKSAKNRLYLVLFLVGIVFETTAFFIDKVEGFPFVYEIIVPKYIHAVKGLKKLDADKELNKNNDGFKELSNIVTTHLATLNSPELMASISVVKIGQGGPKFIVDNKKAGEYIPIYFGLSNEKTVELEIDFVNSEVNKLKSRKIFCTAIFIFALGVIIQIFGYIIDKKHLSRGSDNGYRKSHITHRKSQIKNRS